MPNDASEWQFEMPNERRNLLFWHFKNQNKRKFWHGKCLHVSLLRFSIRYKKFMICRSSRLRQAVRGLMTVFWRRFLTIHCSNCPNWARRNHFFRDDSKKEIPCDILSEITMERLLKWNLMLVISKCQMPACLNEPNMAILSCFGWWFLREL